MKNKKIYLFLSLLLSLSLIFANVSIAFADDYDDDWEDDEFYEDIPGWDGEYFESGEPYIEPVAKIKVSDKKCDSATISWKHPGGNIDGYDIYSYITRPVYNGKKFVWTFKKDLITTIDNPNALSYHLTNLEPLVTYEVSVVPYKVLIGEKFVAEDDDDYTKTFTTPLCMEGAFYTSNPKGAKNVIKVLKAYKEGQKFKGSGQCYGYAEWASKKIAGTRKKVNVNKKVNLKNVKKYILGLKPGSHVRLTGKATNHSIIILKANGDRLYWAQNNNGGNNRVSYSSGTIKDLCGELTYFSKISYIIKTKTFK